MPHSLDHIRTALAAHYRVQRELGRGGMATVYLGEDTKHGRPVAIKVLDPELAGLLGPERFLREIRIAAQLQHPHILPLLDSDATEGLLYYVMPYVEGESLRARLDAARQLPVDEALRLTIEVAGALDYSHRQGLVHRDIKPENILLADGQAVVVDYGIARAIRASGGDELTRTGISLGSPPYMSPEQMAGGQDVDGRSDLYSLGCTLYEMLAGQPPFTGPPESLAHQHMNLAPRPVRDLRPSVPPAVDAALTRVLAKTPADRFATAAEFATALGAGTMTASTPAPVAARKSPARAIAVAVGLVAIATISFVLWRTGAFDRRPGAPANAAARRWVWLADFEGPPTDPSLAPTARDLVAAALDQSEVLATVPGDQMHIALRNAGRPDSTRMTGDLARELAFRSAIPVVVEGRIGRFGASYNIVLRATNSEDGRVIHSASGDAASERELAPVLTRLARDLRRGLGERPQALSTPVWTDAATPSFEAFKLYERGRALTMAGDPRSAVALFRQALAIDPEFATAWASLGTAMGNAGRQDSALAMQREALRHPERLSAIRRLDIQGKIARYLADEQASLDAYDAMLQLNPSPVDRSAALNNKALALASLGRHEEALALFRQAVAIFPIEPPQIVMGNVFGELVALKRFDEARAMLPSLKGPGAPLQRMILAITQRSWAEADSVARVVEATAPARSLPQQLATMTRLSVLSARGDVVSAERTLAEMEQQSIAGGEKDAAGVLWFLDSWLARVAERAPVRVPPLLRGSNWGAAARATVAALAGDSVAARAAVAGSEPKSRAALAEHAEGLLDWKLGRWKKAIEHLAPNARGGFYRLPNIEEMLRSPSRWIVADAYGRLGERDSAIVYLNLLLDPQRPSPAVIISRGLWDPFARSKLVTLYAEMGRLDEAQREWNTLSETCTHPDPQMVALIDETRTRLQGATALGAGPRR